jgi:hypothetical protein
LNINTALKWIGVATGIIGLIFSGFMIFNEQTKKAAVSNDARRNIPRDQNQTKALG